MQRSVNVLSEIYKNAKNGSESIVAVMPKVSDPKMISELTAQLSGYENFAKLASEMLSAKDVPPPKEKPIASKVQKMSVDAKLMGVKTKNHVAQVLIESSKNGITDMKRVVLDDSQGKLSKGALSLTSNVIAFEQNNINRLSSYL